VKHPSGQCLRCPGGFHFEHPDSIVCVDINECEDPAQGFESSHFG